MYTYMIIFIDREYCNSKIAKFHSKYNKKGASLAVYASPIGAPMVLWQYSSTRYVIPYEIIISIGG